MKVFITGNQFHGVWIGADAIVVAETKRKAKNALWKEIERIGLAHKNNKADLELKELDTNSAQVIVINDGDY